MIMSSSFVAVFSAITVFLHCSSFTPTTLYYQKNQKHSKQQYEGFLYNQLISRHSILLKQQRLLQQSTFPVSSDIISFRYLSGSLVSDAEDLLASTPNGTDVTSDHDKSSGLNTLDPNQSVQSMAERIRKESYPIVEEMTFEKKQMNLEETCMKVATELSQKLNVPVVVPRKNRHEDEVEAITSDSHQIVLSVEPFRNHHNNEDYTCEDYAIGIKEAAKISDKKARKSNVGKSTPFSVDFVPSTVGSTAFRFSDQKPEMLLKALNLRQVYQTKKNSYKSANIDSDDRLVIYDMTAGWGRDSLVIADAAISSAFNTIATLTKRKDDDEADKYTERLGDAHSSRTLDPLESCGIVRRIHMIERNEVVATLVKDAIRRLHHYVVVATTNTVFTNDEFEKKAIQLSKLLSFEHAEAIQVLSTLLYRKQEGQVQTESLETNESSRLVPDIIYLDPMFPPRKKKALVKKDMQLLHTLLFSSSSSSRQEPGSRNNLTTNSNSLHDDDSEDRLREEHELLNLACQVAQFRVVVKRPVNAPFLGQSNILRNTAKSNDNQQISNQIDHDVNVGNKVGDTSYDCLRPSYQVIGTSNRFDVYLTSL